MTSVRAVEEPQSARRFRPRLVPSIAAGIALIILLGLGTWQVQRLQWKTDLIRTITERSSAAPIDLADLSFDRPNELVWQHVHAAGRFLPTPERPQRYTVEGRNGVLGGRLLGVFRTDAGKNMLVDRGFTPDDAPAPVAPSGDVVLDAVLRDRGGERQTLFLPDNDPTTGRWFWLDLPALDREFGQPLEPIELQLLPGSPGATPQAVPPRIDLPNNHLGYAITWYGLALGLIAVFMTSAWKRTDPHP